MASARRRWQDALRTPWTTGLLLERVTANPFLPDIYRNPGSAALPVQLHFLFEHLKQVRGLRQADLFVASRIADFLIQAHRLFAEATLNQDELDLYYEVYHLVVRDIPVPDLVIYLQSSVDVMVKRIRANGGVPETKIDREYLQKISDGYTDFFYIMTHRPCSSSTPRTWISPASGATMICCWITWTGSARGGIISTPRNYD